LGVQGVLYVLTYQVFDHVGGVFPEEVVRRIRLLDAAFVGGDEIPTGGHSQRFKASRDGEYKPLIRFLQ
jgi:hypothetical protein